MGWLRNRFRSQSFVRYSIQYYSAYVYPPVHIEAAPEASSRAGSAHLTPLLTPILNLVSYALENFHSGLNFLSGGLSPSRPTPGAATNYIFLPSYIYMSEEHGHDTVVSRKEKYL